MGLVLRRLALLAFCLAPVPTQAFEVHLSDDTLLAPGAPPPLGRIPVLFVHGHAAAFVLGSDSGTDDPADPNYKKNWWSNLNTLPSFKQTLDHPNNGGLDIEPYYIRFADQSRSITEDARELGEAVDQIILRHNPGFDVTAPAAPPTVQVVIIAYSKGTISTRQYLKSLTTSVGDPGQPPLSAPRPNYRPVSEFIAISPPNHGLATPLFRSTTRTSIRQLYNGVTPVGLLGQPCGDPYGDSLADGFMDALNGHPTTDTLNAVTDTFPSEAPGFRRDGAPPHAGTLYVTLYAANDEDMVGGDSSSGDCIGRGVARNLAADALGAIAVNLAIAGISDDGQLTPNLRRAAVHQNTVHTPEVICKALYVAVHHRSMPPSQTCTIVDNVPVVPLPNPVAVVLALDLSGSMLAPACPGCATRLDILKDSVELFARLWSMLGRSQDRLGATYFRTTVDQFQIAGDTLPMLGNADAVIQDVHVQTAVPANRTAMGGGLQRAIETLMALPADQATRRHVVLFTDGMQNVNPMVREISVNPPRHEISDEPARMSSGVAPSQPPLRLDALPGVTVDTIGVGAGQAFLDLLRAVAEEGEGMFRATTDAGDLRQFFVEELVEALRGFSPQLVAWRRGALGKEGAVERFTVEKTARKLLIKFSWRRGQKLAARIFKDGVNVTAAARVASGPFYRIYAFDFPSAALSSEGVWELRIGGGARIGYEAAALVDTHALRYRAKLGTARDRADAPLALDLSLNVNGRPIDGPVSVTARLERPATSLGNVIARTNPSLPVSTPEAGMTLTERRIAALPHDLRAWEALQPLNFTLPLDRKSKGEFHATIADTLVPGLYRVTLHIEGDDSQLGRFERSETVATVVGFAAADRGRSEIVVRRDPERRVAELTFRPQDRHGTLLGPGLASEIRAALAPYRTSVRPEDLGDGRYQFCLEWKEGTDPLLELRVVDQTLFKGSLSAIRIMRGKGKIACKP